MYLTEQEMCGAVLLVCSPTSCL